MRVIAREDSRWVLKEALTEAKVREMALGPTLTWVRGTGSTPQEWAHLGELFDLHPLALEDVQNADQRPKIEDYPGITFIVARVPALVGKQIEWTQVGLFVGEDFIVSASTRRTAILDGVEKRLLSGAMATSVKTADRVLHLLVDALVDSYFPFLDALEDELEALEDVVQDRAGRQEQERIRDLKRAASDTRRVALPMREAMLSLERVEHPFIQKAHRIYFRDVADHMIRITEQVEHVKEVALIVQDSWNSMIAKEQNETTKRLTVIAAVLLVPALLAGLGGMNFAGMPSWGFPQVTAGILSFTVLGLAVAWWRGWL